MSAESTVEATRHREDAVRLHRIMTGYLASKALFAALDLQVFDVLEKGPCTAEELAQQVGLEDRPARTLLLALEGEKLVARDDGRYVNDSVASRFLVSGTPEYMGALAVHQQNHFAKFVNLTEALRENKPVRVGDNYSGAFGGDAAWARHWAEITKASSLLMAEDLAAETPLGDHRHLVDLGCASCAYSLAFARANPELKITAVDQPAVAAVAREFVAEAGLSDRVDVRGANIFQDSFPECDVALLSHVIQGFERERAKALIAQVYSWLPEGGELLLHTHLPEQADVPFPYLFGLILLINNTQGGEAHGQELTCGWLREAGFRDIRVTPVSPISALIRAVK